MVELGYTQAVDIKLIADSQDNRKGHYGEDNNIYLNDTNLNNTKDLATTLGHETSHAIDNQDPSINTNPQNNTSKADNEIYAQNYGDDFSDYVEFASENYGDGSLADTNNNNLGNTPAEIQRNQKLVDNNNQDYAKVDKSKGEDFLFITATAAAAAYAAFVGDGDPVDGLETIGQGNDPLTKVIGQGAQAAIELSYEHFPKATENTLDLIAKVGTQVGNGLDVTVKYIDDKTGNVASAKWNKLDKATQDQIRGGGRILSVIVPAGTAGKIVKGIKEAKALKNKTVSKSVNTKIANSGYVNPPYNLSKPIVDFTANGKDKYVRVFTKGETKHAGRWMMKDSDIKGLTPKEIQDKFALPYLPDHVVDVKPPKGIKMRTGVAKENFNGNGGGTQYELLENININVFNNSRPL
ncbi:hypothetical protein BSPWISOXPB_1656 [uncultured Gammaproteobacteria bacterium]|jgi:hypothetical protein|nr:hypothetical protein BSPWISOXPB_1656 [uncultured Gammaproteobacteria bacterium]